MKTKEEFEKELVAKYPNLYKDMGGDMIITCMHWGIATGPGWFPIIETLSEKLEALILKLPEEERSKYRAAQVKEKLGLARIYMTASTKEMDALISEAEEATSKVCEECGGEGKIQNSSRSWLMTLCDPCEKEWQAKKMARHEEYSASRTNEQLIKVILLCSKELPDYDQADIKELIRRFETATNK